MSWSNAYQDLDSREKLETRNIQKYQFKSIDPNEVTSQNFNPEHASTPHDDSTPPAPAPSAESPRNSLEKELIEKLLLKTDELSSSLAKMQIQMEKQQADLEARLESTKSEAYKDGLREGEQKAKDEMLQEVQKEKQGLINAIIALEKNLKFSEEKLQEFEKDLAQIAIDLAREVIVKEVEEGSQKIALELAHSLIESIKDVAHSTLRVNTLDYPYLRENLDLKNITLEADDNITKGGVVIASNSGNIDGNIMSRFRILKQNVLDNA